MYIMGFSCIKSKVVLFHAYGTLCWNKKNVGHLQGAISSRGAVMKTLKRVSMSSVVCFLGAHSSVFLRRFCHTNNPSYNMLCYPKPRAVLLPQWFRKRKPSWTTLVLGFSILISVLFVRVERIPYSKRFHLVISQGIESKLGEFQWKDLMKEYEGKVLPPTAPEAIRGGSIAKHIIQALHSGLRLEHECNVNGYASENPLLMFENIDLHGDGDGDGDGDGGTLIDCPNVVEKQSPKLRWKPATKHLNDLNWEVIVVDSYIYNALYCPPGKILIYRGLLSSHKSDLEIAIIIGHEIGHAVARHGAEGLAKRFFALILLCILAQFCRVYGYGYGKLSNLILNRLNQRREVEADYIGLMLMASAGYDPQEAPKVFEKFFDKEVEFFSTHPCGPKRAKLLSKTEVMEEALAIYNEVRAGCGVKSFV